MWVIPVFLAAQAQQPTFPIGLVLLAGTIFCIGSSKKRWKTLLFVLATYGTCIAIGAALIALGYDAHASGRIAGNLGNVLALIVAFSHKRQLDEEAKLGSSQLQPPSGKGTGASA